MNLRLKNLVKSLKQQRKNSGEEMVQTKITKTYLKEEFERHLTRTLAIYSADSATVYERFLAISYTVRDQLIDRWVATQNTYYDKDVKRVYYLSLEFLMGRTLGNAMLNLDMEEEIRGALEGLGLDLEDLRDAEIDAGLGNGGLGRLAACFLDSMATLEIPAYGMGIRYEYGMFHQTIENGYQKENPDNWLRLPNPWEISRPQYAIKIPFYGHVETYHDASGKERRRWVTKDFVLAMPYDTPIPGYKNNTVNTLRLWSAKSNDQFGLDYFNNGDYLEAIRDMELSESISKVLYPNDTSVNGKELRLKQQFFLCSSSLHDILRRFKVDHNDYSVFTEKIAIQLNDTHPAVSIAEMMRIFLDDEGMSWDQAWAIVNKVFAYTNHTLLPEALEKWSVSLFERLLPRHLEIIFEINTRFLRQVSMRWPGDESKLRDMSIIEEGGDKNIRMAFLSIVGSHSVNGVAALHSELLVKHLFKDFYELWPEKFNNKTNGVTQRRWVRKSNPLQSELMTKKIGDGWILELDQLRGLEKFATDKKFQKEWQEVKKANKQVLADLIFEQQGVEVSTESMFDVQVKRIHEYKRQLMPILYAVHLYLELKDGNDFAPRTIIIGGKAAPGYWMAKQIIKMCNAIGSVINADPATKGKLRLIFLENYRVSLAEKVFPASDLSEQVSTAGKEASGTGNMKFSLNGALTIGTLDGANVEIAEEVGDENIFIFGKKVEEVQEILEEGYRPWEYLQTVPDLKRIIDFLATGFFNPDEPDVMTPILENLIQHDPYLVFADFESYLAAQAEVDKTYRDQAKWTEMAILNVARMGKFSTDRTIDQYNKEVWGAGRVSIKLDK